MCRQKKILIIKLQKNFSYRICKAKSSCFVISIQDTEKVGGWGGGGLTCSSKLFIVQSSHSLISDLGTPYRI
jgi:hypothetical protein